MSPRSFLFATGLLLATTSGAFAQSGQGGYLGLNLGATVPVSYGIGVAHGSGQGGYLGMNPGAAVQVSHGIGVTRGSGQGGAIGLDPSAVPGVRG